MKKVTPWKKGKGWDYSQLNKTERMDAKTSIEAGVAWLFRKAAKFNQRTVESGDVLEYVVKSGDYLWNIAIKLGTTVDVIKKYNTLKGTNISIDQILKYKKAKQEWYISGWKGWNTAIKDYNGGGNPTYLKDVTKHYKGMKKSREIIKKYVK